MESIVARRYYFKGRVQGVGFRYTTASFASGFPVAGYVRNLKDGRVELYVEADLTSIECFLQVIREHFQTHIQDLETQDAAPRGYRSFAIQHDS